MKDKQGYRYIVLTLLEISTLHHGRISGLFPVNMATGEIEISSGKGSISPASFLGDTLLIDIVLTLLEISTLQHGRISSHSM